MPAHMKKPASTKVLKRPSTGQINNTIGKLAKGVSSADLGKRHEDEEEDEHDDDEQEAGEDENRDKAKGQKFAKMRSQLPEHVIDLIDNHSMKASSPRSFKTQVINKLFKRNSAGKLVLNLSDPIFIEHKKVYAKKYSKEEDTALPESIMKGLYFNNSKEAFENAKKVGEIIGVDGGDGKTFWSFTSFTKGFEQGREEEQKLSSNKKVTGEQAQLLAECFKNSGWTWKYSDSDVKGLTDGKKIPKPILQLVQDATASQQRLAKEGMALIKAMQGKHEDERVGKLKKGHATIQLNLAKLGHMLDFHELADEMSPTKENLDLIMKDMALHVQEYNTLVETTRGHLKSLKN